MLSPSDRWKSTYPGAHIGVLAMRDVTNPQGRTQLDERREALEAVLRSREGGQNRNELRSHPVLQAYAAYYKRFGKTYHVQLQLESIVFKGKGIPRMGGLVEAMFMAELENLLLTAGHDLDAVAGPLSVEVATGSESYVMLSGEQRSLKPGDMFIRDEQGVLSSVIYGPDSRTRITPATRRVLFTVYAPPGVATEKVRDHLGDLEENVLAFAPRAQVEVDEVIAAG